jgi:hypothetical protein
MSPLAVLTKLTAMLRSVPAVQFVFAKFETLRRNKESGELASEFLGEASDATRSMVSIMPLSCRRPATIRLQYRKRMTSPREKS